MFSLARQGWLSILANYLGALFSSLIDPSPSKLTWPSLHTPCSSPRSWAEIRNSDKLLSALRDKKRGSVSSVLTKCDQCILDQVASGGAGASLMLVTLSPRGQVTLLSVSAPGLSTLLSLVSGRL